VVLGTLRPPVSLSEHLYERGHATSGAAAVLGSALGGHDPGAGDGMVGQGGRCLEADSETELTIGLMRADKGAAAAVGGSALGWAQFRFG